MGKSSDASTPSTPIQRMHEREHGANAVGTTRDTAQLSFFAFLFFFFIFLVLFCAVGLDSSCAS